MVAVDSFSVKQYSECMKTPLTEKQSELLGFITLHIDAEGYSPTHTEICEHFGWASRNTSFEKCNAITKKGWLRKTRRGYVPA